MDELKGLKFRTYNAMIGRIAALAGSIPTQIEVPGPADRFRHRPRQRDDHLGVDRRRYQVAELSTSPNYIDTPGLAATQHRDREQEDLRQTDA